MKGYYKNQEATDEIIDKDGWINTGDIGHVDSRGFYYLTGRAKNIIVTEGGKNVFPEEIEDAFQLYDDVDQICVLPFTVDKEKKSEGIAALVKPSDAAVKAYPDPSSLKAHIDGIIEAVNSTLLPYQRIRKTIVIDEDLEVTSTKKVKRFKVLAKYKDKLND
jgi:long-chain acyl-CoA synthetase